MSHAIAAYEQSNAYLGGIVRDLRLDHEALNRPLRRCDLSVCGATCCHDGVYLSAEEANVVRGLAMERRESFERLGLDLPDRPVVYGRWRDAASGPKTATRPVPRRDRVADYPAHFPETGCVFLLDDARCALQVLATEEGRDPWFYKPITCWLHPLSIAGGEDGEPFVLTLHDGESDPQRYVDYDGFVSRTPCGRIRTEGEPAWRVLRAELERLGELGERDLIGELEAG